MTDDPRSPIERHIMDIVLHHCSRCGKPIPAGIEIVRSEDLRQVSALGWHVVEEDGVPAEAICPDCPLDGEVNYDAIGAILNECLTQSGD